MGKKTLPRGSDLLLGHFELTEKQKAYAKIINDPKTRVVFLSGPAGTSKTLLSVYCALDLYNQDNDKRILYLRSVVESAEKGLGFLKGDIDDKFSPYMAPLLDKIDELLNDNEKAILERKKVLEATPINFLRGQSWRNKVVIGDEAQNYSKKELVTVLTRIGKNTKLILCGDPMQSDIKATGFADLCSLFDDEESRQNGVYHLTFDKNDVLRDPILTFLIEKIEKHK